MNSFMATGRKVTVFKMGEILNMYSYLQIVERMYNNYYRRFFWPAVVQLGLFSVCISAAMCVTKWDLISKDPRGLLPLMGILDGSVACVFLPYCASKINSASLSFLNSKCSVISNLYMRKRMLSKRPMRIYISDNFIDAQFQLSVFTFCLNAIFSLIVVLK